MDLSPFTRRAGELALDVIRDVAPESEPAIDFAPAKWGMIQVSITATVAGKRNAVAVKFAEDDDWQGVDNGEWLAATFWYQAREAFGLQHPESNNLTGGLPKCLRPTSGSNLGPIPQ